MIFVIITFSLFYFTYLYLFLYVCEFTADTGGLAFPRAIYQTMTGLYFAEVCLIGLFFITPGARAQGVVMVVVLVITILFQMQLAGSFDPLITYLPVDIQEELASQVQEQKLDEGRDLDEEAAFQGQGQGKIGSEDISSSKEGKSDAANTSSSPEASPQLNQFNFESPESSKPAVGDDEPLEELDNSEIQPAIESDSRWRPSILQHVQRMNEKLSIPGLTKKRTEDGDDDDENVDTSFARKLAHELTHEELIAIAFQHEALRARPPVLWLPEDELGIARDEIHHTKLECGEEIQITCEGATLDSKGNIIWQQNPPDYVYIPII